MTRNKSLCAFFGHHKCASRWIQDIVAQISHELDLHHVTVYNETYFNQNLPRFVKENHVDFLSYTNADYQHVKLLKDLRGFHVVRDPRDVCVSAYFSHLNSHSTTHWPGLAPHRKKLQKLSKHDGLLADMEFNKRFMQEMVSWDYNTPNILQIKMEDLTRNPYEGFSQILSFMHLLDDEAFDLNSLLKYIFYQRARYKMIWIVPKSIFSLEVLPIDRLLMIVWQNRFSAKTGGREPGTVDPQSHYRKGQPGDWRNHFSEEHVAYFRTHYNNVLLKLDYEKDPNWE